MKLDRQNVVVVSVALLLALVLCLGAAVIANRGADDLRREREVTTRAKVVACRTIDDEAIRALCITTADKDGGAGA